MSKTEYVKLIDRVLQSQEPADVEVKARLCCRWKPVRRAPSCSENYPRGGIQNASSRAVWEKSRQ